MDLNSLIQQRKMLRKYQGDANSNVATTDTDGPGITIDGVTRGTEANPVQVPEIQISESRYPTSYFSEDDNVSYETLDNRLVRYNNMWSAGTIPELPFGTAEYGYKNQYSNGMYLQGDEFTFDITKATHVAGIRKNSDGEDERLTIPINEYLYGRVQTEEEREAITAQSNKEREILAIGEAPNKNDYNFALDGELARFQADLNEYQDKQIDYIYTKGNEKGEGFYKDNNGNWVKPSYTEIKNAYQNLINQETTKENQLGIDAGVRSDGTPATSGKNKGILSSMFGGDANKSLAAVAGVLVADDVTVVGVANDVVLPLVAAAMAVESASAIPWGDIWAQTTSTGAYSDLSVSAQNTLKSNFETLTQTALGERIWTTQNNMQGIMVPTAQGEVFMSREQIAKVVPYASANQMTDADRAYEDAYPSGKVEDGPQEVDEDGNIVFEGEATMTATGPPPAPPEDNEDPKKEKGWRQRLAKSKDWSADKASRFGKLRDGFSKWTGGKLWRHSGKSSYSQLINQPGIAKPVLDMMTKTLTLNTGKWWATRWGARISMFVAAGGKKWITGPDASDIWSEESKEFISEFDRIIQSDSTDTEKSVEIDNLFESKGENYFSDSADFQNMRYFYTDEQVTEFESGYKGQRKGDDVYNVNSQTLNSEYMQDSIPERQQGGFVNPNAQTPQFVQEFKQGGLLKYQGNNNSGAIGLPAGYTGVESPYPSITTPDNSYAGMIDFGGFTQPGMAGLNKHGFQNYNDWRSFMKQQKDFSKYDWNNTTHWGKQHQGAWEWTTSNRTAGTPANDDVIVEGDNDGNGSCGAGMMDDGNGNCIPIPIENSFTNGGGDNPELKTNKWAGAFKMAGDLGMSVIPAITAWNQANLMEGEVGEFGAVPDIESPIVNIKAPVKEVDQQIATTNEDAVMTANLLKEKGASAAAILSVEKKRREAVSGLEAQKQDLLMKADNEGKKLTAGYYMDAEKQNQVKNIKMKLEEMDFRTATKKAKIDIMDNLMKTISGVVLDSRKMYSDKNIMAMVSTALTAGTGMAWRKTMTTWFNNMGISEQMIRDAGGDELYDKKD